MRLLLDTHVFLWACGETAQLQLHLREAIESETNAVFVSAASAWEIAIKREAGRLNFPIHRWGELIEAMGFDTVPITPAHAIEAGALPRHHLDPFDRMLVAQARVDGMILATKDRWIKAYDVTVFQAG